MCWWWWLEIDPYFPVMRTKGKKWPDIYCIKMHFIQYVCTLRVARHGRCVGCRSSCSHRPTCCKLLYAEVNGLLWINNTLRFIFCDLNIAHLISSFRGWGTSTRLGADISGGHNSCRCARGDVSSCSRPINGLSRNLDTRPRGDTETRRRGYADNITHDHGTPGHRAPGSWHNGLGLRRSLVTVQI